VSDETPEPEAKPEAQAEAQVEAEPKKKIGPSGTPAEKKKKKKKDAAAEATDPRAKEIAVAFEAGNFVRVRELAAELQKSDDVAVADVGRDYAARISVDPVQIAFLGLCAIALLTIAWTYIPH
jgi:hypothetical protein